VSYALFLVLYYSVMNSLSFLFSIMAVLGVTWCSENFECGFYSILTTEMRFSFNYFLIILHFLIFEQELILALLLIFGVNAFNSNNLLWLLLVIIFIDLFVARFASSFCHYAVMSS